MKLSILLTLLPLALAHGGGHGGRPRDCPTKTVEVCAEETKAKWGKPIFVTTTVADTQCTATTVTEVVCILP
ncbi:hypothetical protein A1Q2_08353 [Trichosporon asahii var. asahii CBS 8904]|uniref:Uncharacterized protein n=2 Tax=Trichosporon asahii var. asahii TaxID=189963 RepID=K1V9K8_TRIAC|nr:hypothetical protein A1Q1_02382 [Trichosporon asahii var. asahii CBS 2479]EJT48655.1 hypothetical protein A1Q1_02382 [Trichosporon asahii var. asahii CBS 2479]EKC97430.1 hypothetical protein A1Q2_08353 [Trichosporon asahii var. asahii CBS 8904]